LWIARETSAPRFLVAVTLMINTVCVALLQVRLTRRIDRVGPSSRAMARSGFWVAGGFALIAFASGQPAWLAVLLLCAGALVHVVGEMIGSGGQWGLTSPAWPHRLAAQSDSCCRTPARMEACRVPCPRVNPPRRPGSFPTPR
jgi:hypothetical protein